MTIVPAGTPASVNSQQLALNTSAKLLPRPPEVPSLIIIGSSAPEYLSSLMISCSMMVREGTPIPCYGDGLREKKGVNYIQFTTVNKRASKEPL